MDLIDIIALVIGVPFIALLIGAAFQEKNRGGKWGVVPIMLLLISLGAIYSITMILI